MVVEAIAYGYRPVKIDTMQDAMVTVVAVNAHADRDVDHQQRAEEPGQPQILLLPAAVPRRLQQRGQKGQPDRDRDEKEVVDRGERELHPRQVNVHRRRPPVRETSLPIARSSVGFLTAMVLTQESRRIAPM